MWFETITYEVLVANEVSDGILERKPYIYIPFAALDDVSSREPQRSRRSDSGGNSGDHQNPVLGLCRFVFAVDQIPYTFKFERKRMTQLGHSAANDGCYLHDRPTQLLTWSYKCFSCFITYDAQQHDHANRSSFLLMVGDVFVMIACWICSLVRSGDSGGATPSSSRGSYPELETNKDAGVFHVLEEDALLTLCNKGTWWLMVEDDDIMYIVLDRFELSRGNPMYLAGTRLNHSAKATDC
ncbi:hypothetical protein V8G54_017454 [Vigna mungo]|uniref:Uncharacterized protein n=1 Tax=Vigna mungo TaxID=3915 RepID=A0AAQ3RYR4_VIGMU